ncbi:gliding motility-associated C-terminal domain-containing protein [Algoriphagus halophilus]|uniref:DUF7507 domain-containing protein n=1 Tax=Algoriphagus halophilus TaxID=226505 RepID=UPI00358FAEB4
MSAITFVSSSMNSPEGTLMPGENAEYTATYVITQVDTDTRFINNQAEATASYGDGLTVDDLSGDTIDSDNETQVDLCQDPSLDLTKTLISNDDELGGELSFEIKVENTGNVTLYDIYVEDETTGDNWTIAELIPGAEQTFTVNVTITQEIIDGECYENTAFAEAREYLDEQEQPGSGNSDLQYIVIARDNDSAIECFTQTPSIAIVKLAGVESEDDCYDTGDLITYTFTVYNTGNVTLNNVEVNEFHFTGTGTMSAITFVSSSMNSAEGTLLPNESAIYTATYEVTLEDTNIRYINNQAEATAVFEETTVDDLSGDSIDTDNETQVDLCQNPALSIEKSIIAGNPYSVVGDVVEYQYIVTNTGNVTLDGPFTVVDDKVPGIPAAVENTLAPNESLTLTATYTISQADLTNGSVTNIASAIGYLNETEVMSNPDQATAEAIFNDILAVDDNAGTYTISGGVASINAFDNDSYLGGAANTGNVILTTVVPDPSGVLTVDENGVITIAANAVAGDYELTYRITEIGNADNYDEAVISATVEPVLLIDEIESYCELDAPYLRWLLEPANFNLQDLAPGNPNPLTMIWYDSNDQEIIRYENIPMEGYMLFPGADTLPGGYGSQWPGWKLVKKQWISGDFNFAGVREEGAYVRFELNPEVTSEIAYPGATEACNPNPNPPIAVDDDMTGIPVSSQLGYSNIVNVLDNDILGDLTGLDTDLVDVFEVSQSTPGALILDTTTGLVSVSTGLTPGIYTLEYRICTNPNPTNCDTAIVTVLVVQPSVQIEKTVVSNDDQVGGFITYNIKVINDGDVELNDIEVVDELTGDAWTVPTLAPGSSANYITQLVITQDIIEQECVTNTASATVYLSSEVESIVLAEDSDSVVECMTLSPGIDIEKVANPSQVEAAGQEIIYSLTVTNTGNVILYDVIISDPLTSLNLNVGTIAPGLSSTINSPYTVTQSDMDAGSILNVATTSGTTVKGEVVEDQDEVTVEAVRIPNIDLNKTVDLESVSREGIVLNYTLEVTNTGNVTLSSGNLVDPKTGLSLPNISLAPGEMKSFSTTYTVTLQDLLSGKPILNIATVNAVDTFSGTTVQAQGQATVSVNLEPGIEIVKTADIEEATFPGQEITYTLTVTNTGTAPLVNVLVSDPLTGFEETIGLLLPNETEVFTTTYMVTLDDLRNKEQVSNTATVKGTAPNGTEVEDMDSVDVAMNLPAPPPPPPAPDPEIIANDDDFGTYFLSYGGRLGNILENDLLNGQRPDPADVDFEFTELDGVIGLLIDDDGELSLIPGVNEAREYRLKYILREAGNPSNNDDATVVFRLQNDQVDLNVSKTSFEAEIFEGDVFDYEIVVTNGDTPASNVIVTDNLPTGVTYLSNEVTVNSSGATVTDNVSGTAITWTIPVLAADASVTIRVTVKAGAAGTITNTVIVGSDEDDTDESNNQDDDVNTILPFHIPNVITPNNDGDNDTFVIQGLGKFVSNEITIFNRYGDHVLEQENYQNDWDAPGQVAGTYFFVLTTVDSNDKTHEFKGWIQVIKEN